MLCSGGKFTAIPSVKDFHRKGNSNPVALRRLGTKRGAQLRARILIQDGRGEGVLAMNNVILTKWCIALSINIGVLEIH